MVVRHTCTHERALFIRIFISLYYIGIGDYCAFRRGTRLIAERNCLIRCIYNMPTKPYLARCDVIVRNKTKHNNILFVAIVRSWHLRFVNAVGWRLLKSAARRHRNSAPWCVFDVPDCRFAKSEFVWNIVRHYSAGRGNALGNCIRYLHCVWVRREIQCVQYYGYTDLRTFSSINIYYTVDIK